MKQNTIFWTNGWGIRHKVEQKIKFGLKSYNDIKKSNDDVILRAKNKKVKGLFSYLEKWFSIVTIAGMKHSKFTTKLKMTPR